MDTIISSTKNPLVKLVHKLDKSRDRMRENLMKVEGLRECKMALNSGFVPNKIMYCSQYISLDELKKNLELVSKAEYIDTEPFIFDQLVYRKGIANCLILFKPIFHKLKDLKPQKNPLYLIIDSVEKPGNLGAMLRTADAAGVDAVMVCDPHTDVFNPNCIRSSLGAVFTKKTITTTASECIDWLLEHKINIFVTHLEASKNYAFEDYTKATAIVMGSEAFGVDEAWTKQGFKNISIPQFGQVDSMNVANSAAIMMYEAIRQRKFINGSK